MVRHAQESDVGWESDPGTSTLTGMAGLRREFPLIAVHDYSGHPFQVQLSRELARRGYRVTHYHCPSFSTPKGKLERDAHDPDTFRVEPVKLRRPFAKYSGARRFFQEIEYGWRLGTRPFGWLFGAYLMFAGTERFLVEVLRAKDDRVLGVFTIAQATSLLVVITGLVVVNRLARAANPAPGAYLTKAPS